MGILLILFVFVLAACDDSEKTATNHESDTVAEQHESKEKEKTPEAEENEESAKESEESSESIEAAYKITENWSIVPIRSEEHTSELQSRGHLVCRLLLEK